MPIEVTDPDPIEVLPYPEGIDDMDCDEGEGEE